jgi:hypothetical protein
MSNTQAIPGILVQGKQGAAANIEIRGIFKKYLAKADRNF